MSFLGLKRKQQQHWIWNQKIQGGQMVYEQGKFHCSLCDFYFYVLFYIGV